jgi:thiamine pyrophosphokinase
MNNTQNRILILTGGRIEDEFLTDLLMRDKFSMIIAADNGLTAADRLKIPLDFIVGDFDSVPEEVLVKYQQKSTPIETFPTEKDKTDTQIAIELALMHNPSEIVIIGATGSRLDHVMANIHLLMLPMQVGVKACLLDSNNKIYLSQESFTIEKDKQYGSYVSLLPFTEKVNGLTLKGFKYPLNNVILVAGSSIGVSNEIKEEKALIEFSKGILLVIEAED